MRSGTGAYLRSCRSISRNPVILPINPAAPASSLYPHPEERRMRRVSKDEASSWPLGSRRRYAPPHHEDNYYAPIAIFGSASALTFNSFSARRYSTGITLRNFGSHVFQFARISAAFFEPLSLA